MILTTPIITKRNSANRIINGLALAASICFAGWGSAAQATTYIKLAAGPDLQYRLQTQLITAAPDTIIELPEGKFEFSDELISRQKFITLRGQGMYNTVLNFKNQSSGAQGLLATGTGFTLEDIAIEDSAGDGFKAEGVDGLTIRRVRVEWLRGSNRYNGSYGLYPVRSSNILMEDNIVKGASDAGVYVGQSNHVIVRRNRAELNVAGIEIENTQYADVYDNVATNNTGGILVFDMAGLQVKGHHVRVFHNEIYSNNNSNFASPGATVSLVPRGTGFMVMANDDVEAFDNNIYNNYTVGAAVISYLVTEWPYPETYDPIPERINIHDNRIVRPVGIHVDWSNKIAVLVNVLHWLQFRTVSAINYDGVGDALAGPGGLPAENKVCLRNNKNQYGQKVTFSNLQLTNQQPKLPFPGGPVLFDDTPYNCTHPAIDPVVLTMPTPPAGGSNGGDPNLALCNSANTSINTDALMNVSCPNLSDYHLYVDAHDPRKGAQGGVPYDLTTPLFSDYANKYREVILPASGSATYAASGTFDFPVGTVISKTFAFAQAGTVEKVVETRLLIRRATGWVAIPYQWKNDMSDATLAIGGASVSLDVLKPNGDVVATQYAIPNANQCGTCHSDNAPIGPKAGLLNKLHSYGDNSANQLQHWASIGILSGLPANVTDIPYFPVWNNPSDGTLEQRAKAYLDANCAHCHNPVGYARNTALYLNYEQPINTHYGLCKTTVSAGIGAGALKWDVVPGKSDQSIMVYRLDSVEPAVKMPELSKSLVHDEGVQLVSQWINTLQGSCDQAPPAATN